MANDSTVLGNFNDAHFTKDGVTSSFFKKDGKFYVRTDGPDGKPQDFDLPYTFGVSPLQQYLVPFPNGRMQSFRRGLGFATARSKTASAGSTFIPTRR